MPKPDKVLRFRPLVEVEAAVAKLKKVVLFHPKPIVVQEPAKMCVCRKPPRKKGKKTTAMTQCDECYEWFHNDCAGIADDQDLRGVEWKCEWCEDKEDREGYHRWREGRKRPKKRHFRDMPKNQGIAKDAESPMQHSAPVSWEGKVEQIKELARRAAVKKRKLMDSAQELVDGGGHHEVDAEGMAGLELRAVDDGLIDELIGAGMIDLSSDDEED